MSLRDEPPISGSTMAFASRNGLNLPQARSVEQSASRVRQYISGGQVERPSTAAPAGVDYTRRAPKQSGSGLLPRPAPLAPTPQPVSAPYNPPATSTAMPSRLDPGFLHSVAMGASAHLSPQQFGASW